MKPEEYFLVESRILKEKSNLSFLLKQLGKHGLYPDVKSDRIGGFSLTDDEAARIIGSILHDFYTVFENIAKTVASRIDKSMPSAEEWHRELLMQMTLPVPGLRPYVLSTETASLLERYRSFRHVFRNIYGFRLESARLMELLKGLPDTVTLLDQDLDRFIKEMRKVWK